MCVLTFIPHPDGQITITHNRDEHISRSEAWPPQEWTVANTKAIFPKDPSSDGTWFALHEDWVCCMLNGAFERHERRSNYRVSRGTVILQFLEYLNISHFTHAFDASGMEPFTFIGFDLKNRKIYQIVWDERILHQHSFSFAEPHIWSSATLYNAAVRQSRKHIFEQFVADDPDKGAIMDFHHLYADQDLGSGFKVNINDQIHTVAITQVNGHHHAMKIHYESFYEDEILFI